MNLTYVLVNNAKRFVMLARNFLNIAGSYVNLAESFASIASRLTGTENGYFGPVVIGGKDVPDPSRANPKSTTMSL